MHELIVVGSFAVLFAALLSPPPETVTLLVTVDGALFVTLTVRVIAGWLAPGTSAESRVQVNVARVHDQPPELILVAVSPLGSVSVMVIVPMASVSPLFVTVIVYCAPCWLCWKLPVCVFVTMRSGPCFMLKVFDVALVRPALVATSV